MKILNECSFLKEEIIKKIEAAYNCKYVMESCCRGKDGHWVNMPCAIFYTEEKHATGSNYMAMFLGPDGKHLSVADGISATEPFNGLMAKDDTIIYSHYRHDFRKYDGLFIDGGRDYLKCGGQLIDEARQVRLKVVDGEITLLVDKPVKP